MNDFLRAEDYFEMHTGIKSTIIWVFDVLKIGLKKILYALLVVDVYMTQKFDSVLNDLIILVESNTYSEKFLRVSGSFE